MNTLRFFSVRHSMIYRAVCAHTVAVIPGPLFCLGTLTQNEMVFKRLHLGTVSYGIDTMDEIQSHIIQSYAQVSHVFLLVCLKGGFHDCSVTEPIFIIFWSNVIILTRKKDDVFIHFKKILIHYSTVFNFFYKIAVGCIFFLNCWLKVRGLSEMDRWMDRLIDRWIDE